jgi:uroporphyrin-III C-methyltransferase
MIPRTGILLAAHGSRQDPTASELAERLAASLRRQEVADEVLVGYHQGSPGFSQALDRLRADRVLVIPLFTSAGYYTEQVLPTALTRSARFGMVKLRQTAPLGTHPAIHGAVRDRILEVAALEGLDLRRTSVLIVGHGTSRHPRSRDAALRLAGALERSGVAAELGVGFLDDEPGIETASARLTQKTVLVVPFLIGGGGHATTDLPRRLGLSADSDPAGVATGAVGPHRVVLDIPVGAYKALPNILTSIARRELPPAGCPGNLEPGSVALVGAGPGDPGLITVRGLALLRGADVILHDRLVSPELLAEARRDAELIDVGKSPGGRGTSQEEINGLLVRYAAQGRAVVRLKGGDPFVFGRGSEELDACEAAGIPCTVVSGVSSAIAVPAAAGIPVTARGEARSFAVITARGEGGDLPDALERLAANADIETLVLLMGRSVLAELSAALIAAGRDPDTPAACIQDGTTQAQRVTVATLATLAEAVERDGLTSPIVTVIGDVAARAAGGVPC